MTLQERLDVLELQYAALLDAYKAQEDETAQVYADLGALQAERDELIHQVEALMETKCELAEMVYEFLRQ